MGNGAGWMILQQLVYQVPVLLVYLVGAGVALSFMKTHRVPAMLTLLGLGTLVTVAVVMAIAQGYWVSSRITGGATIDQVGRVMTILGFIAAFVRAGAMGLLIAAVFAGRKVDGAEPMKPPQFGMRALFIGVTLFCLVIGSLSVFVAWLTQS